MTAPILLKSKVVNPVAYAGISQPWEVFYNLMQAVMSSLSGWGTPTHFFSVKKKVESNFQIRGRGILVHDKEAYSSSKAKNYPIFLGDMKNLRLFLALELEKSPQFWLIPGKGRQG